jgi:hypothetical protein
MKKKMCMKNTEIEAPVSEVLAKRQYAGNFEIPLLNDFYIREII